MLLLRVWLITVRCVAAISWPVLDCCPWWQLATLLVTGAAEVYDEESGDADEDDCDDGDADSNACFSASPQTSFVEVCYWGCC